MTVIYPTARYRMCPRPQERGLRSYGMKCAQLRLLYGLRPAAVRIEGGEMMSGKTVWKFQFQIEDSIVLQIPSEATILHLDAQQSTPCIWVLVDPDAEPVERHFQLRGTGQPFQGNEGKHIGSFQMLHGSLVFHLFEEAP